MRLLNIEASPRGSRSASVAVTNAFLEAYRQACPGVMVDTLNVWEEKLPDFDQEAIGAKYKGVNKEPMDQAETAVWNKIQELIGEAPARRRPSESPFDPPSELTEREPGGFLHGCLCRRRDRVHRLRHPSAS